MKQQALKARTVFGAGLWTDRPLEPAEKLMAHDVSEALFKARSSINQEVLQHYLGVPIWTRVEIGKFCRAEMGRLQEPTKQKGSPLSDRPAKR